MRWLVAAALICLPFTARSAMPYEVVGTTYSTNYHWLKPRWVDEKFAGIGFGLGASAPGRVVISGNIYGRGFDTGDDGDFSLQFQHGLAATNSTFPNLYYQPHCHISVTNVPAGESNATFVVQFQIASIMGGYTNIVSLTNTLTFTNANTHRVLSFGLVTNNALSSKDSVVARGNVRRIAAATGDLAPPVVLDSLDFHIPVDDYGSDKITGD